MDPAKFPKSAVPLNHAQYGPITDENLKGINKGKVAVVTGGARGEYVPSTVFSVKIYVSYMNRAK